MRNENPSAIYTTRIIKAGALLADTKTLLANWDESRSVAENFDQFRRNNIFGKVSRSRVEDILPVFRQRYLTDEVVIKALTLLVKGGLASEALDRILYFHAAQSDRLLHDLVTEVLLPFQSLGRTEIHTEDIVQAVTGWAEEGKTTSRWVESTIIRVTQGLLATLRDFGVLQGNVNKRIAPVYLPVEAFAYIAFYLRRRQPSGERLLDDPEWSLFFLSHEAVEHFFLEAHQRRLLEYHAAGSVTRISFPADTIEEYACVIVERPS